MGKTPAKTNIAGLLSAASRSLPGSGQPDEAFGQLDQQDLYPDVEAAIVQFDYSFVR